MKPADSRVADALYPEPHAQSHDRLNVLDGWRAVSILLVLVGHWLPIDRLLPGLNESAAATGMAIFFTLSGFLITRFLLQRPEPAAFLIRRFLRILPLAWSAMLLLYLCDAAAPGATERLAANWLFFANLPPARLFPTGGGHLWSLCVEMQFYVGVALIVALAGRRGLLALPLLALAVTAARIVAGQTISIVTWHRLDEILAGATLALIHAGRLGPAVRSALARCNLAAVAAVAIPACYFLHAPIAYARPWAVAALVGVTLFHAPAWLAKALASRPAAYIADISYALYVFHGMLGATWLGSGEGLARLAKRPLLIAATFLAAHLSTTRFEAHFIRLAKQLTARPRPTPAAPLEVLGR